MSNHVESHAPTSLVVVGAGQIGRPLVETLLARGHRVTWVSRHAPAAIPEGARHVPLDASDGAALGALSRGARAIVAAVNPASYDADVWAASLPPLWRGLLQAARLADARLVLLDNLYAYRVGSEALSPETEQRPTTRKGEVRKQLAELASCAHREQGVRVTTLRASDFWGPGLTSALLTESGLRDLRAGKRPMLLGDPDAVHAFSHRDDVVESLIALAFAPDDVEGRVFHAPVTHVSPGELVARLADAFSVDAPPRRVPRWVLRGAGLFSPTVRGMVEMLPQWERPYRVDDRSYTARFGRRATTLDEGVAQLAGQA